MSGVSDGEHSRTIRHRQVGFHLDPPGRIHFCAQPSSSRRRNDTGSPEHSCGGNFLSADDNSVGIHIRNARVGENLNSQAFQVPLGVDQSKGVYT